MGDAEVSILAQQKQLDENGERISSAEFRLDGAEAKILLKVNKDGVIAAINLTPEEVKIQAAKINLEGYVTATQLSTEIAAIENSFSDMVSTKTLYAQSLFQYQGWTGVWKSGDFVTSVTFPRYVEDTIYYKNWNGENTFMRVLTPTKNEAGGYNKSDSIYYLGR